MRCMVASEVRPLRQSLASGVAHAASVGRSCPTLPGRSLGSSAPLSESAALGVLHAARSATPGSFRITSPRLVEYFEPVASFTSGLGQPARVATFPRSWPFCWRRISRSAPSAVLTALSASVARGVGHPASFAVPSSV